MSTLAYTFWHWRLPSVTRDTYEERQRAFHAALAAHPSPGFQRSYSGRLAGVPWANQGGEAYQDRYLVDGWGLLEDLESAAISGAREAAHAGVAASVAGAAAGMYGVRLGTPPVSPRHSYWFSKPQGVSYAEVDQAIAPLAGARGVLWIRRMVLGPTPEFCLETVEPVELPARLAASATVLEPTWPLEGVP